MTEADPFSVASHCVLVTGGTRGLGRAISLDLAHAGADVIAAYARNDDAAAELQREASERDLALRTLRADLTMPKALEAAAEALAETDRTPSIVHCAATGIHKPLAELTKRHWDWTFATNLRAFFELVIRAMPTLREGSSIVALSSEGAVRAVQDYTLVGASKGGLESLCRHMARELGPQGIRVNVLSAGSVPTQAWDAFPDRDERLREATSRTPMGRLVSAEEVARATRFLVSSASSGILGQTLVVDGGKRIVE